MYLKAPNFFKSHSLHNRGEFKNSPRPKDCGHHRGGGIPRTCRFSNYGGVWKIPEFLQVLHVVGDFKNFISAQDFDIINRGVRRFAYMQIFKLGGKVGEISKFFQVHSLYIEGDLDIS